MRMIILLATLLPASARAQVELGTGISPETFSGRPRKEEPASAVPLAAALSLSAGVTDWLSLGVSSAATPAEELGRLLSRGYHKRETLQLALIARASGKTLGELAARREKGERMRKISESLGVAFDPVLERSIALEREVDDRVRQLARVAPLGSAGAAPPAAPKKTGTAALTFPDGKSIAVELAVTPGERERGLMFRRSLPPDYGMLFVFPREQRLSFWMKNTFVDLDILFIGSDKRITALHHDVPRTEEGASDAQVAVRGGVGRYVLELPAGTARRLGLSRGDRLSFSAPEGR